MRSVPGILSAGHPAALRLAATALVALSLGACAGASRFDRAAAPQPQRVSSGPVYQTPPPSQGGFQSAPPAGGPGVSAPVTAQELPPPGGQPAQIGRTMPGSVATPVDPSLAPAGAPVTTGQVSGTTERVVETPTVSGGASRVATLGERSAGGGRGGPVSSRDGVVGGWTAREATGSSCRVTLSSSPALDLYRASASGCANKELQKVSAWDYRDGEVYLYQPGGAVAARMRVNDSSSISGSIARSGAGFSMSR